MMYFCYEMSGHKNKWSPVVYYYKPVKSNQHPDVVRSAVIEVEEDSKFVYNGEPMFGLLQEAYPAPAIEPKQVEPMRVSDAVIEQMVIDKALAKFQGKLLVVT